MANYERDANQVFDGGEDEEDVEGSRLPLLIVIALLVLAAFGAVVYLAYQKGLSQGHSEIPRVIAAQPGPAKVAPTDAGGTPTPYTGLKIYQQPAPSDEVAEGDTAPAPGDTPPAKPNTMAATVPPPVKPAPAPATTTPPPAATVTAKPPVAIAPPPVKPAPAPQVAVTPPPAPVKPAVAAPVATPAPATGGGLLQIGSYKSEADANAAWTAYKAKHGGLVGGLSPDIKQVDLGAKGTWYRLRIAGDKAFCAKLTADGGACIPTK